MKITFEMRPGNPSREIVFFWKMTITAKSPAVLTDHFIPELFYDFFFIKEGSIQCVDPTRRTKYELPQQALKPIHTRPLVLVFSRPLVLYGARFFLTFAESFWADHPGANSFLAQTWVRKNTNDLQSFASQVIEHVQRRQTRRNPYPMLSPDLEESDWLVQYSPRHKRRLYKATFGLSRKELQGVRNIHAFLEQTCDFASQSPRIIQHINPDVFYDQPHLNHTFKKMTGFSPVEYFEANSILQDNLMSASYNEISSR